MDAFFKLVNEYSLHFPAGQVFLGNPADQLRIVVQEELVTLGSPLQPHGGQAQECQ